MKDLTLGVVIPDVALGYEYRPDPAILLNSMVDPSDCVTPAIAEVNVPTKKVQK